MAIDPIGKGGGTAPIAPTAGGIGTTGTEEFSVERKAKTAAVDATSPLDRLKAGEVDVNGYLDLRVEQATAHLVDRVDADRLTFIREALRSQLERDPALVDLVQKATGSLSGTLNRE